MNLRRNGIQSCKYHIVPQPCKRGLVQTKGQVYCTVQYNVHCTVGIPTGNFPELSKLMQELPETLEKYDTVESKFLTFDSNISAKSKPYSKLLQHVNQGTRFFSYAIKIRG